MAATEAGKRPGRLGWRQGTAGELLAEYFGTFILICFGDGVVAMAVAALNQSGRGPAIFVASGDWLIITLGWAFAVTMAVYVAGGVSGAHINPAVTLASALRRGLPMEQGAGLLGGADPGGVHRCGARVLGLRERDQQLRHGSPHHKGGRGLGGDVQHLRHLPSRVLPQLGRPVPTEPVGTAFLVCFVFAIIDEFNQAVKGNLAPFMVGMAVFAIGTSFGANSGYAINPARDFGPRVFAAIAGWDKIAFPGDYGNINTYFWIPIVAPLVGACFGALIYDMFIRDVLIARGVAPATDVVESGRTAREVTPAAPDEL